MEEMVNVRGIDNRGKMCNHGESNIRLEKERKGRGGEGGRYCKRNH